MWLGLKYRKRMECIESKSWACFKINQQNPRNLILEGLFIPWLKLRFPPILAGKPNWMRNFHLPSKMRFWRFRLAENLNLGWLWSQNSEISQHCIPFLPPCPKEAKGETTSAPFQLKTLFQCCDHRPPQLSPLISSLYHSISSAR